MEGISTQSVYSLKFNYFARPPSIAAEPGVRWRCSCKGSRTVWRWYWGNCIDLWPRSSLFDNQSSLMFDFITMHGDGDGCQCMRMKIPYEPTPTHYISSTSKSAIVSVIINSALISREIKLSWSKIIKYYNAHSDCHDLKPIIGRSAGEGKWGSTYIPLLLFKNWVNHHWDTLATMFGFFWLKYWNH